jgi:hypothetical protein
MQQTKQKNKKQIFEAYWLGYEASHQNGGEGLDLKEIPDYIDVVKLAFVNLWPHNEVSPCHVFQKNHGWKYIKEGSTFLHKRNKKVMMSIIGTPDPDVKWNKIQNPEAFAFNAKRLVIDDLGLDGIDIDNEDFENPGEAFFKVVAALRQTLPQEALLTYTSYIPDRDLPWLKKYGNFFNWVSLMAYWKPYKEMIELFKQYADVLGNEKVLIGVANQANQGQNTPLEEVKQLASYPDKGGIMQWALSAEDSLKYAEAIHENLNKPL